MAISIVLADDHPVFLHGLQQLLSLEKDFNVLAACAGGDEILPAIAEHKPDILVADVRMPGKNIFEVVLEIKKAKLATRVVLLTATLAGADAPEAVRLGVDGVVLKAMAPTMIIQCIRKVHGGGKWLERDSIVEAMETVTREARGAREVAEVLSPREIEIVQLLISGLRNKEIGKKLFITEGTVKAHLHKIYAKLDIDSRLQLTVYARDKGLI